MIKCLHIALIATGLICSSAYADLVVSIGNSNSGSRTLPVFVEAGSRVTLGLYIHNDRNADLQAGDFGLAFDISLPGTANLYDGHNSTQLDNILSNFTITPVVPIRSNGASIADPRNVVSSANPINGYDVLVDYSSLDPITFTASGSQATAIHLANISFTTAANTPFGTYGFKFNPFAQFPGDPPQSANSVSNGHGLAVGQDGTSFNRFTVTAVPEPSSLLLGFGALILCGSIARWRKKQANFLGLECKLP